MFANLKNQATQDGFVDELTVRLPGTVRVFLQVANAAVLYQEDKSGEGKGLWTSERFLTPTVGSFDRVCSGLRFRSAVPGTPAQVSVELLDADELAGASDSVSPAAFTVDSAGGVSSGGGVSVPVGTVIPYAGPAAPSTEWIVCDGATLNSVADPTLATLFSIIGIAFGGTGASDFKLPDLRGRVVAGLGTHADVNTVGDADAIALANRRPQVAVSFATSDPPGSGGGTALVRNNLAVTGPAWLTLNYLIRAR